NPRQDFRVEEHLPDQLARGVKLVMAGKLYQKASLFAQALGRQLHGIDDVLVAGAAAEIARDGLANFGLARVGVVFEEGEQRHQEAGCAEATLQAVGLVESL